MTKKSKKETQFQFLHSYYKKPRYNKDAKEDTGKDINDFITIVYRNEDTSEKHLKIIPNPKLSYYEANDDYEIEYDHLNRIELENVHSATTEFKHVTRTICEYRNRYEGMNVDFNKYIRTNQYGKWNGSVLYSANTMHLYKRVFSSDIDIEDYYKGKFVNKYPNAIKSKLTKSFLDIEVDSIDYPGFANENDVPCPVNAVTIFFDEKNTFYTLLLDDPNNDKIPGFKKNYKSFLKKIQKEFGNEYKYKIKFFEDEEDLILYVFKLINTFKPDFSAAWNLPFDFNYLINRLGYLEGFSREEREMTRKYEFQEVVAELVCHADFPSYLKEVSYIKDTKNQKATDKIDVFTITSYTYWIDLLTLYASLRKGKEPDNLSLSHIAQIELKDDKLNYSEEGYSIKTLAHDDYEMFVMYNIKDVLLLSLLEKKNNDIDLLYLIADVTKTRIHKAMRKTVSLKNLANYFYLDQGYVQGNNYNLTYGEESSTQAKEKIEGAFVGNPLNNDYNGALINGTRSRFIFNYVIDYDYSALYPSIIRAFNIDACCQYGRLIIPFKAKQIEDEERDLGGEFIDNLESKNIIKLTNKFLGTPSIEHIINKCKEKGLVS